MLRQAEQQPAEVRAENVAQAADDHRHDAVQHGLKTHERRHIDIERDENSRNGRQRRADKVSEVNDLVFVQPGNDRQLRIVGHRAQGFADLAALENEGGESEQRETGENDGDLHRRNARAQNIQPFAHLAAANGFSVIPKEKRNEILQDDENAERSDEQDGAACPLPLDGLVNEKLDGHAQQRG